MLGDLGEAKIPVYSRTNIVCCIDGTFLKSREDIGAWQRNGGGTKRLEYLSNHAAWNTKFHALKVSNGIHRFFGMNDIRIVMNMSNIKEAMFLVDFTSELFHAQGIKHDIPLCWLIWSNGV